MVPGLSMYPNPAVDVIHVNAPEAIKEILITDMAAVAVAIWNSQSTTSATLSVQDLLPGAYVIVVKMEKCESRQIIIIR